MRRYKRDHAFTLTELLVVVIIIGVMAAFTVPNYTKSVERSHQKDAETQLKTIWSADQIYRAQNGAYWPPVSESNDIAAINSNLGLGIIPNGMTYNCASSATNTFTCTASRDPSGSFVISVNEAQISSLNPSCTGNCPQSF